MTLDLTFEDPTSAAQFTRAVAGSVDVLLTESRPLPWGQNYGIVTDPDGYGGA